MARFHSLHGDANWIDHGGLFAARTYPAPARVFEVIRWHGSDIHPSSGRTTYYADKIVIDLDLVDPAIVRAAVQSYGWQLHPDGIYDYSGERIAPARGPAHDRCIVECLSSYGAYDLVESASDTNWQRLYRSMRRAV